MMFFRTLVTGKDGDKTRTSKQKSEECIDLNGAMDQDRQVQAVCRYHIEDRSLFELGQNDGGGSGDDDNDDDDAEMTKNQTFLIVIFDSARGSDQNSGAGRIDY